MSSTAMQKSRRKSLSKRRQLFVSFLCMFLAMLSLAIYNIRIAQRLFALEKRAIDSGQLRGMSLQDIQRLREAYEQEVGPVSLLIPDEAQNQKDEQTWDAGYLDERKLPRIDWKKPLLNNQFDLGVPVSGSGNDQRLIIVAKDYGKAVHEFKLKVDQEVNFRLLVTRYPSDDSSQQMRTKLAEASGLPQANIVFVLSGEAIFHRAHAGNILHQAAEDHTNSVLAMVDVDMWLGPRFLYNALNEVTVGTVYFPIVFSNYRPSSVDLVEEYIGPQSKYSAHRGMWRDFGYGMYAINGLTAKSFLMDESFKGWGGEDSEFYNRARGRFVVSRTKEYDLVHRWHAKSCILGDFVEPSKLRTCTKSRNEMEGSNFGQYIRRLNASESSIARYILSSSKCLSRAVAACLQTKLYSIHARAKRKREANLEVIQILASSGKLAPHDNILIGVTATRATFPTRVKEMVGTWAKNLPDGVYIRFFVGDMTDLSLPYVAGSTEDIQSLAMQAGISDLKEIVVMNGVRDDEYPLVDKAAAVLKHMGSQEENFNGGIQWYLDIDDDTYVHVEKIVSFLHKRDPSQHHYLGQMGMGAMKDREMLRRGRMTSPYCMGGPGIAYSKKTFEVLVSHIDSCISQAAVDFETLYDDVIIGKCLQRHAGIGCWDKKSYKKGAFAHNYHQSETFPRSWRISSTLTLHPHKSPGMMKHTHERFTRRQRLFDIFR